MDARTPASVYRVVAGSPSSPVPLRHYQRHAQVTALMVEIRRDTNLAEPTGPLTDGMEALVDALTSLIGEGHA